VEWILLDNNIHKNDCYRMLQEAGIDLPMMYKLGYNNNNCIGCVKGQAGYWNKYGWIFRRVDRMAKMERKLNVASIKPTQATASASVFFSMSLIQARAAMCQCRRSTAVYSA
jgi:hypothetical protein